MKSSPRATAIDPRLRLLVNVLVVAATILFYFGVTEPIMTIRKLVVFDNSFSIVGGVRALFSEGEWLLGAIIGGFSIVLPIVKIALLSVVANHAPSRFGDRLTEWLEYVGKWSMLDVFVVAVLLASIKLGALVTVEIHRGLHAFAASVLCTMVALFLIERERRKRQTPPATAPTTVD